MQSSGSAKLASLRRGTGAQRPEGYTADEIIGQHFSALYTSHQVSAGHPEEVLRNARAAGEYSEEGWRVRKDGSRFGASIVISQHWSRLSSTTDLVGRWYLLHWSGFMMPMCMAVSKHITTSSSWDTPSVKRWLRTSSNVPAHSETAFIALPSVRLYAPAISHRARHFAASIVS
ncbi:PAS/PAC sensor signal transduction histidine kinase [Paraburkholderia hospita]|uniref:PAS/PAC sensor signal transduction histidine kinase n=1 Tax=Paraburkholderia hospita TaxID=169430 RepID=A0ABN0FB31_9BURK|nr:PAS/PAC sensor signal transduction histidine kinase [Paraburkholderia hospita]